jgi:hypothetical protein
MLPNDTVVPADCVGLHVREEALREQLADADIWVTAAETGSAVDSLRSDRTGIVIRIPRIFFRAFHPDAIFVADTKGGWLAHRATLRLHSAIVVWGWKNSLGTTEIAGLFSPDVFDRLGYARQWPGEIERLRRICEGTDIDFSSFIFALRRNLPFMHTVNHPRSDVLIEVARQVAVRLDAEEERVFFPWEDVLTDALLVDGPVWPTYPYIAESLGIAGGLVWKQWSTGRLLGLREFIEASLESYSEIDPSDIVAPGIDDPAFDSALRVTMKAS